MLKKFIPCIYLHNGNAVASLENADVISQSPVMLAEKYDDDDCDAIIIFDMSEGDAEHEESLDIIKEICSVVSCDVYGAGNVKRMEDIKKLLYAGCKKACLNFSKQGNIDILQEVSEKFGKDKICICYTETDKISAYDELIKKYADELILLNSSEIKKTFAIELPTILCLPDLSLDKMIGLMSEKNVSGLSGRAINVNSSEIRNMKNICAENDLAVNRMLPQFKWEDFKKNSDGMVPVVVQDYRTDAVLMVAYFNEESYKKTLETGKMTYFSRSRNELWLKGETSGHFQYVKKLTADCDMDTILAKVKQVGVACHTGSYSCFFNEITGKKYAEKNPQKVLDSVFTVINDRKTNPREGSYTNYLFDKGLDKILKKVGEESTEMVIAAKNKNSNELIYEMADFLYHMMVLMAEKDISWEEITDELARR
ncbi:bifunctional phosphoribosyl-AMP cyclohydrolase/phosphoribosyl-ATP diphosphatase HisIE [Butyrivibrio sp. INlla16]|uniref:bifunctional phosphoribosyl-AMP cyclohydrolase/phosphoribosyl-ATP diphosphatase HisIE n=1 Tax=Butyrivibrio sp. INlla16 TaxID=1520807 RepID=UPI000888A1C5|nr:bifunctional phosphoribosyl-AMP cyclohydrolase/phosphoribosyl-ATP diphosphatase HisIE [Butyrivibrio sp. INlla16]SDB16312.1 phosphoribosyl-ATP pyrophosphatase /phosphoribosyl-AMP cyclohydrolase [Butyrivibrio sp. INlla16]